MSPVEVGAGPSRRVPLIRDDLALVDGYHSPQLDVAVRLNTNEAPEPPPDDFVRRLAEAVSSVEFHRYPSRSAEALRGAIGATEGVGPERVFAANGSNEVLQCILLAFGGHGRSAMTFEPTYALHSHIARVTGTSVIEVERNEDFTIDLDAARRAIQADRPAIVFVCSPNNPTGMIESAATVHALLDSVEAVGALLIVDEAYGQFAPWSATSLVEEGRSLVVTRTYSKTWSMAAMRLGYAIGPTWLVDALEAVVLPYHLDAITQAAGVIALDYLGEMRSRVASLVEERGRVAAALAGLDVDVWPSAANFILFRPRSRDGALVWQELVDRSILVRNCASWPRLEGCLRVTLGTEAEDDAFVAALGAVLDGAGRRGDPDRPRGDQ
ncbi:MAG: histidinol-phosphate transaminase [Microthrixaceae bacterium]